MMKGRFVQADGSFDYAKYRNVQEEGNKRKLTSQWVDEATIKYLAKYVVAYTHKPSFGICHGTRRGAEQKWFAENIPGCHVIGTEISSTATQFPNTVQWDFHDENPDWVGKASFVYSNSWDHSYDPLLMFGVWSRQLTQDGMLIIEHTRQHIGTTELDPFGATLDELKAIAVEAAGPEFEVVDVLTDAPGVSVNGRALIPATYVIVQRERGDTRMQEGGA